MLRSRHGGVFSTGISLPTSGFQKMKKWHWLLFICGLVVCLFMIGRRDTSVDHYNSGCRYYTTGQYNTGGQYGTGGQYDLAVIEFTKAIEINPRYAEAYIHRGLAYDAHGEHDQAILDYDKAFEINPRYAKTYIHRGI